MNLTGWGSSGGTSISPVDGTAPEEATWETLTDLEDKVISEGGGDDTTLQSVTTSYEQEHHLK